MKSFPLRNPVLAILAGFAAFFFPPDAGHAATIYWNGQTDFMWTGLNWTTDDTDSLSGTSLPNGDLVFSATGAIHQQSTLLGADFSIHSLTFNDPAIVRISGSHILTIANDGSLPGFITVDAGAGDVTIQNDLALAAHLITVEGSALLRIDGDIHGSVLTKEGTGSLVLAGTLDSGLTLNVNAGTVYLIRSQTLTGLHISAGATVMLAEHGPDEPNGTKVIDTAALTIDLNGGALDLTNNAMIVRGGATNAYPVIFPLVRSGMADGPLGWWDGPGIRSSTAAANGNLNLSLGLIDNTHQFAGFMEFAGVTGLTPNDALLSFTLSGDGDLSRSLDSLDYFLIDIAYGSGLSGWLNGDFNYSGTIDSSDYFLIDVTWGSQLSVWQYSDTDADGMPDWWEMVHALKWWYSGEAQLVQKANQDRMYSLKVMILPLREVPQGIYTLADSSSPGTQLPANVPAPAEINTVCNDVFHQAGIRFSLHPTSGARVYGYDTIGFRTDLGDFRGFDETAALRPADGHVTPDELQALFNDFTTSTPPYQPKAKTLFENHPANGKIGIAIVNRSAYPYDVENPSDPPYIRGGESGWVGFENLANPLHLCLAVAHEIGHALNLATAKEGVGGDHDLPPYAPQVANDKPNGVAPLKPGPAYGGTEHKDEPERAIMAQGHTPPPPGKMPWLFGRWMRHEDWRVANEEAGLLP